MRARSIISGIVLASAILLMPRPAIAQGTLEDYRRAATVRQRLEGLTVSVAEAPTWIDGTNRFWYRRSVTGGNDFVLVDAATQQKQPAFDHAGLATGLSQAVDQEYTGPDAALPDLRVRPGWAGHRGRCRWRPLALFADRLRL